MGKEDALARHDDGLDESISVKLDARRMPADKAAALVNQIVQYAHFTRDIAQTITESPEATEYVLRIPKAVQEGLDSGEYSLMKRKTGEILAEVMHKSETSNRTVIKQKLDVVERTKEAATAAQQSEAIATDLYNVAIQQQMAEISAQLEDVLKGVQRIEQGQQDDRYALIEAAESQLKLAMVANDETHRLEAVQSAQHFLQEGSAKIARAMARRLQEVEEVPEFAPAIVWKMLSTRGNYYDKMNDWFDRVQDDFDILERAHALLVLCAIAIGEPDMLPVLMDDYRNRLGTMATSKLLTMGRIHPELDFTDEWFADVGGYLDTREEATRRLTDGEYIEITLTNKMLAEAIDDEARRTREQGERELEEESLEEDQPRHRLA